MNEANILVLLDTLGVHNGELHGEWVRASCPAAFARHKSGKDTNPSFGIHANPDGRSGYNCYSCNFKGRTLDAMWVELMHYARNHANPPPMDLAKAADLIERENEIGYQGAEWVGPRPETKPFEPWPEWWLETFPKAYNATLALDYLHSREISVETAALLDLRFDPKQRTIGFPFRNSNGDLAGMRGRFLQPKGDFRHYDYRWDGKSNNTALVWLGEHHIDWLKPVIVVEGQFDYAKVFQLYRNVVANLTTGLSKPKIDKLENCTEVIEMFDNDLAGRTAGLLLKNAVNCQFRHFDYQSMKAMDPGSLPSEELAERLEKYVQLDPPLI